MSEQGPAPSPASLQSPHSQPLFLLIPILPTEQKGRLRPQGSLSLPEAMWEVRRRPGCLPSQEVCCPGARGEKPGWQWAPAYVTAVWGPWAPTLSPPRRSSGAAVPLGVLRLLPDHLRHLHQPDPQVVTHVLRAAALGRLPAGLARHPAPQTPSHPPRLPPRDLLLHHHGCVHRVEGHAAPTPTASPSLGLGPTSPRVRPQGRGARCPHPDCFSNLRVGADITTGASTG